MKFPKDISELSDSELFKLAKRALWEQELFIGRASAKFEKLIKAIEMKNEKILEAALEDVLAQLPRMRASSLGMSVVKINRLDFMSNEEIESLVSGIGASPRQPRGDFDEPARVNISKALGLDKPGMLLCVVDGYSMKDANIFTGDTLVVDTTIQAEDGEIVVALYNDNALVKRFRKRDGSLSLVSENPNYDDILVCEEDEFKVLGVVRHVIHSLKK
ncbi:MAG: LexA family protein [Chloroflexota bacterium]